MGDSEAEQYTQVEGSGSAYGYRLFMAPWDGRTNSKGDFIGPALFSTATLVALVLETLFSFVLGFGVTSARFYTTLSQSGATPTSSGLQDGFFIGAVHATIWLVAWSWAVDDYNLKRFLNWSFLAGRLFKVRYNPEMKKGVQGPDYGILAFILYGGAMIGGAAIAGALLSGFSLGNLPNPTGTALETAANSALTAGQGPVSLMGATLFPGPPGDITNISDALIWFVEFLGVFIIVLANTYNDERHQDKNNNGGNARENEIDNHARTGMLTAAVILAVTTFLYPLGSYSFGPVPYFAGLIAVGHQTCAQSSVALPVCDAALAGNPLLTPLVDWAHYLFTPIAAGAAGGLLAYLVSIVVSIKMKPRSVNGRRMVGNRAGTTAWKSAQTPLLKQQTQNHLQDQSGLHKRSTTTTLPVRAFNN